MRIHLLCLAFLVSITLTACGFGHDTVNPRLTPAAVAAIQKGTTTKDQVRLLLGAPQSSKTQAPIPQPPGTPPLPAKYAASEMWAFWSSHTKASWFRLPFIASTTAKQTGYTVIIFFNERGVVIDCQTQETHT